MSIPTWPSWYCNSSPRAVRCPNDAFFRLLPSEDPAHHRLTVDCNVKETVAGRKKDPDCHVSTHVLRSHRSRIQEPVKASTWSC